MTEEDQKKITEMAEKIEAELIDVFAGEPFTDDLHIRMAKTISQLWEKMLPEYGVEVVSSDINIEGEVNVRLQLFPKVTSIILHLGP